MVKGAVPGSKGGWVTIKDAVKKAAPADLPMPAAIRAVSAPAAEVAVEGGEA
jgi:large subunit ribosomal protein L3